MLRCVAPRLIPAVALTLCCALSCAAQAQSTSLGEPPFRKFPATALRGTMQFVTTGASAQAVLNGQPVSLAPGARIFDAENRLLLLGEAHGLKATVHYTVDMYQQPLTVWVLNEAERKKQPWPKTPAEAQAWRFDDFSQTWSAQP